EIVHTDSRQPSVFGTSLAEISLQQADCTSMTFPEDTGGVSFKRRTQRLQRITDRGIAVKSHTVSQSGRIGDDVEISITVKVEDVCVRVIWPEGHSIGSIPR